MSTTVITVALSEQALRTICMCAARSRTHRLVPVEAFSCRSALV
jgi:hypothetical protein